MNFNEISKEQEGMVYNFFLHYVQNMEGAWEISQDVFVSIYHSTTLFQHDSSMKTCKYRTTIKKRVDFLKSRQRKKRVTFLTSLFFCASNDLKHNPPENNHPGYCWTTKNLWSSCF